MASIYIPRTLGGTLILPLPPATTVIIANARDGQVIGMGRDGKRAANARDGQVTGKSR